MAKASIGPRCDSVFIGVLRSDPKCLYPSSLLLEKGGRHLFDPAAHLVRVGGVMVPPVF